MKHIYLFLLCLISLNASAQYGLLEQEITIHITDKSLEEVLNSISESGDFYFSYNPAILDLDRRMTFHLNQVPIKEVLDQVISDPSIQYKEIGNHIILNRISTQQAEEEATVQVKIPQNIQKQQQNSPLPRPKPSFLSVKGVIVDAESGRKLAHASVYEKNIGEAAVTNDKGAFRMVIPTKRKGKKLHLSFKHRLYTAEVLEISPRRDTLLEIRLFPVRIQTVPPKTFFLTSGDTINPLQDVALVSLFVGDSTLQQSPRDNRLRTVFAQFSFLPGIGTQQLNWQKFNRLSFNLLAGYSAGLKGIELGLLMNAARYGVAGVQIAGVGNAVGGNLAGLQLAGVFNVNKKSVYGAQIAGFNNWADSLVGVQISPANNVLRGRLYGAQLTGGVNVAAGELYGAQLSGCANVCAGSVKGWQVAGLFNWGKELKGVQLSGLANISQGNSEGKVQGLQAAGLFNIGQTLSGAQISSLFNISTGDFHGAQISTFFNAAKKGRGIQIGLVNISDSLKGIPIGLLNIIRDGHNGIEYDASFTFPISLRLKTGNHRLYNIFALGMRPTNQNAVFGYGYGLGSGFRLFNQTRLHAEILAWQIHQDNRFVPGLNLLSQMQFALAFPIFKQFQFSLGPNLNFHLSDYRVGDTGDFLSDLAPGPPAVLDATFDRFRGQFWIGAHMSIMLLKKRAE